MRITTVINQKGGVGKTTTSHALATGLTYKGYKTLSIDTDPQGNLTYSMNANAKNAGTYELLKATTPPQKAIQKTPQGDIIASSRFLATADIEFTDTGREYLLLESLESIQNEYDFIIIDCPPTLGVITINALTVANDLIIPLGADAYSVQGLSQLHTTIGKVKKRCNPQLSIAGILITRYNGRTVISQELRESISDIALKIMDTNVFQSAIRESITIKEVQTQQTSLYQNYLKSNVTKDYLAFVDEYLERVNHA
ncbi:MAG: AAA family ATPase [Turicibacter sp.]|nr:AAA family ATPase [Turicibacter sp.]